LKFGYLGDWIKLRKGDYLALFKETNNSLLYVFHQRTPKLPTAGRELQKEQRINFAYFA